MFARRAAGWKRCCNVATRMMSKESQGSSGNNSVNLVLPALVLAVSAVGYSLHDKRIESLELRATKEAVSAAPQSSSAKSGHVDVVLGAQWGDEGKGKLVDVLSSKYDYVARVAGGSNAGHTIVVNGVKHKFHLVPSGILHVNTKCVVGNGVVVHLRGLMNELQLLKDSGVNYDNRLFLSDRAHIVFDFHQQIDGLNEKKLGDKKLGTTNKGIGPAYGSKIMRNGVRVGDLRNMQYFETRLRALATQLMSAYPGLHIDIDKELEYYNSIRSDVLALTRDTIKVSNDALKEGKQLLIEGANATMLDLDFGTYPYVTSSSPSIGSAFTGLGIPPTHLRDVIGIVKAYCTRVGEGPFPTELKGETEIRLRTAGAEFGTTTGRPRRCGWVDVPQVRYAIMINGINSVNLTKIDVLTGFDEIKIGVRYRLHGREILEMPSSLEEYSNIEVEYETFPGWKEDISKISKFENLPRNCQNYIVRLEQLLGVPVKWVGVGAGREDMIVMPEGVSLK